MEGILLFAIVAVLAHRHDIRGRPGLTAGAFFIGYAVFRTIGEFFREPDPQLGFLWVGATMGQLLCIPMILFGLWLASRARKVARP